MGKKLRVKTKSPSTCQWCMNLCFSECSYGINQECIKVMRDIRAIQFEILRGDGGENFAEPSLHIFIFFIYPSPYFFPHWKVGKFFFLFCQSLPRIINSSSLIKKVCYMTAISKVILISPAVFYSFLLRWFRWLAKSLLLLHESNIEMASNENIWNDASQLLV